MARRLKLSLAWKFFLGFAVVVIIGMATVSILANLVAAQEFRGFINSSGMSEGQLLMDALAAYYQGRGSWEGVEDLIVRPGMFGRHGVRPGAFGHMVTGFGGSFSLVDHTGQVIASTKRDIGDQLSSDELASLAPITVGEEEVGYLLVEDPIRGGSQEALIGRVNRTIWLATLVSALAAVLIGSALVLGLLRPVRELTSAAQALAGGDLGQRVPVRTSDELGELSSTFNRMADSLEKAERLRQEMTADIAHELRNPLAVMQARVEAVIDGVYPPSAESLEPVLEQSKLLNRLVDDLRTLALVDAGQLELEITDVDLNLLAQRVVDGHQTHAMAAEVELRASIPAGKTIQTCGDAARLQMVLGNLLSNALRHTPAGGEVVVSLAGGSEGEWTRIEVKDSGEGIPEESLPYVFERFYRADRARSRQAGGSGLGLSIARKLVEAHGGKIRANNRPEGGALIVVELPPYSSEGC
ncbi:MAG: ATP-binding protein [Anaerolineales bacterium]|jgi:signal transduction histidine kinase